MTGFSDFVSKTFLLLQILSVFIFADTKNKMFYFYGEQYILISVYVVELYLNVAYLHIYYISYFSL